MRKAESDLVGECCRISRYESLKKKKKKKSSRLTDFNLFPVEVENWRSALARHFVSTPDLI